MGPTTHRFPAVLSSIDPEFPVVLNNDRPVQRKDKWYLGQTCNKNQYVLRSQCVQINIALLNWEKCTTTDHKSPATATAGKRVSVTLVASANTSSDSVLEVDMNKKMAKASGSMV